MEYVHVYIARAYTLYNSVCIHTYHVLGFYATFVPPNLIIQGRRFHNPSLNPPSCMNNPPAPLFSIYLQPGP